MARLETLGWFTRKTERPFEARFLENVYVHVEGLYRYAMRLERDPSRAEDLVQESMTKAFKAFDRLPENSNYRAWAYTIVRNTFISRRRQSGRLELVADAGELVDASYEDPVEALARRSEGHRQAFEDEVLAALDALPSKQRSVVVLCDVEGLSYEEISGVVGCPVGTVRSRIHHGRRRLRAILAGYARSKGYGRSNEAL